jgi:hypothetical protein
VGGIDRFVNFGVFFKGKHFSFMQGPAELPDDFAKHLLVEPLAWEFVLECSSRETQSISVAMERWSVEHRAFAMETFKKQRFCLDSEDISSALQYSSGRQCP